MDGCGLINLNSNYSTNIFCLNIRSLRKHFDELILYLNSINNPYKIIILTEVWIKSGEEDRYQLPGYNMLFQPRPDNQAGGCVIYMDSTLTYSHQLILLPTAEVIRVTLDISCDSLKHKMTVFGIYRQCKYTFTSFKNDFQGLLDMSNGTSLIIGDLNICILKKGGSGEEYLNMLSASGYESFINAPTRIFNNSISCLDHVMIKNSNNLEFQCKVVDLDLTDHCALSICINRIKIRAKHDIFCKTLDKCMLQRQLKLADWSSIGNCSDVNLCVNNFYNVYNECHLASCKLKKINSKNRRRCEWVSDELINLINRKNHLFKIYSRNRNDIHLRENYKALSKSVTRQIRNRKLNYYSTLIDNCNGDSKKYWNVVKKIVKRKSRFISEIRVDDSLLQVVGNEKKIADTFNDYFSSIVSKLRYDSFGCDMFIDDTEIQEEIFLNKFEVTYEDVIDSINRIKNKPSCGLDGISISVIKDNIDIFGPVLHDIYKKSLEQGIFPNSFKIATVVPIYKSGDDSEVSSYRPISVINTIAKVFETIIKNKLMIYFTDRNIFSKNQYGFIPSRGTDLAIEKHIHNIATCIDMQKYTLALYLDFKKAFDVLDIDILLRKFKTYGIGDLAYLLLESFCKDRQQVVKINGIISNVLDLKFGTAQGGVLGPIMFLIYINDLLQVELNSSIYAYADDTALVCSAYNRKSLLTKINLDLSKVSQWLIRNKLLINTSKTKCILFFDCNFSKTYRQNLFDLKCHSHQCIYECTCSDIEIVESTKYLGLYVDQHLKWNVHIGHLTKKLRKINYSLYHIRNFIQGENLKRLYLSWFESTLRYGIIHYGGTYPTILKPVLMCQRLAVRTIFRVKKTESVTYLFQENNLLTVLQLHIYSLIIYIHKNSSEFPFKQANRTTRSAQVASLLVPNLRKELSRHQFCYLGPRTFNEFLRKYSISVLLEKKPKVKIKALEFVMENPSQL